MVGVRRRAEWRTRRRSLDRATGRTSASSRVGHRGGIAVGVRLSDRGPRPPEALVVLVAPGGDQGVGRGQVDHREQARAVAQIERVLLGEPASDGVVVRGRIGLPEGRGVALCGCPRAAGQRADRLDLVDLRRVRGTRQRVDPACGTASRSPRGTAWRPSPTLPDRTPALRSGPASGCHTPGTNVPNAQEIATRPSCPSASIASAAIVPTSMPWSWAPRSGFPQAKRRTPPAASVSREQRVQHPERRSRGRSLRRSLRVAAVDEVRPPVAVGRVDGAIDRALHHRHEDAPRVRRRGQRRRLRVHRIHGDLVPLRHLVAGLREGRHDQRDGCGERREPRNTYWLHFPPSPFPPRAV